MNADKRLIAILELMLLLPAALFMAALVLRSFQSLHYLSQAAQEIVMWYAGRIWTLWILLISLPLAALVLGGVTLLGGWRHGNSQPAAGGPPPGTRLRGAMIVIAAATLAAGGILAVVAVHMLMN